MNKLYLMLLLTVLNCMVSAQEKKDTTKKHVILISIDGLRPEMYLDQGWPAEHLRELMHTGTYAQYMKSVFPSFTYPSHVAMLTGALPIRGGIYYNAPRGSTGDWNWFLKDIKSPTLWQALKARRLTSAAVEWPVSVGDDITWNVPEIWDNQHPEDRITTVRKYSTPGLVEELERNATGKLDSSNMNEEFGSMDGNAARMAAYIYKTYHPSLLAVHFAGVDGNEHGYGREAPEVKRALENADHCIGLIMEAVERSGDGENTTVLVVGDHGFSDIYDYLQPNVLLKGLPAVFQPAGGSAFLYGKTKQTEKEQSALVSQVKARLEALPDTQRRLFRILERKELDLIGADGSALLALTALPGWVFGGGDKGGFTGKLKSPGGHHGYDPELKEMHTGFIAWGKGIQQGKKIRSLCVTDVAPLIAKLLGLDFISPDGVLPAGVLKD